MTTQTAFNFDGMTDRMTLPEAAPRISADVQQEFNRRAFEEAANGAKWIGAKAIAEDMRRYSRLHSGTDWKINNSDVAQLAANAEAKYRQLVGKFKHRKQKEN